MVMISHDKKQKECSDAKNAVEEYVYDMRGKLEGGEYEKYADERNRQKLLKDLRTTEDWLYGQGNNQDKDVYLDRLKSLKVTILTTLLNQERSIFFFRILEIQFANDIMKQKIVNNICKIFTDLYKESTK